MDKTEVLRILTGLDDTGAIAEVHFDMSELGERAEAIAQAAEEERTTDKARIEALLTPDDDGCIACDTMHKRRIADLRAQVAVLAEALGKIAMPSLGQGRGCTVCHMRIDLGFPHVTDCFVGQALSAAPKVAWHKVFTREQNWGDYSELDNAVDSALEDMNEVEVFVVECPWARGQEQSTEQPQESEQEG